MPDTARQGNVFPGALWRGHVFLFDKAPRAAAYTETAGTRLLLIGAGLEAIRLTRTQFLPAGLPLWLEISIYLAMALVATRVFARVSWTQIGFSPWAQWNAIEKSYLIQVVILVNVVFLAISGGTASINWAAFAPYLIYGFYQEVLYRGLLQTDLVRRWGAVAGILLSNLLFTFGPLHYYYFGSPASVAVPMFGAIFAIGLLFAVVFHRSGNLWIVAIMHAFGNAYAIAAFGQVR
jgi:membrane protease YdiL (CAAX protease family)